MENLFEEEKYELVNTLQWCLIVHILGGFGEWFLVLQTPDWTLDLVTW